VHTKLTEEAVAKDSFIIPSALRHALKPDVIERVETNFSVRIEIADCAEDWFEDNYAVAVTGGREEDVARAKEALLVGKAFPHYGIRREWRLFNQRLSKKFVVTLNQARMEIPKVLTSVKFTSTRFCL